MDEVIAVFDPEFTARPPTTIYAVKYRGVCQDGRTRTYVFLLGSKAAYDQRIAGKERGQGFIGRVEWEAVTPAVKKPPPVMEGQGGLF